MKRTPLILALALAPLLAGAAFARIEQGAGAPPSDGPYALKCWQEGRVILELSGRGDPQLAEATALRFSGFTASGRRYDLTPVGSAVCLVDRD
jgi:hypothetical protein